MTAERSEPITLPDGRQLTDELAAEAGQRVIDDAVQERTKQGRAA